MKYLISTTRTVRIRLSRVIAADSPEQAQERFNTDWREEWQKPQAESFLCRQKMLDDLFAKPLITPGAPVTITLVGEISSPPEFYASIPKVILEPTDPLIQHLEIINEPENDNVTPTPNQEPKKIKVGKGKNAHYELKLPEPITLTKILEYDGKLWKPNGYSSCGGQSSGFFFVRLIPRAGYFAERYGFPVRTHNWLDPEDSDYDRRYDTDTGLLCLYQDQEYVILDTEHLHFEVNLPEEEDDEEQLALTEDEDKEINHA